MTRIIFPHLSTSLVELTSTRARFQDAVLDELTERGLAALPSRDVFKALWPKDYEGVMAQFLVRDKERDEVTGYASLHFLAPNGRHINCSVTVDPTRTGASAVAHVHALTINYAFAMWNLRKVSFWTVESSLPALRTVSPRVVKEGTLTEYVLDEGRLRDASVFVVFRDDWDRGGADYIERIVGEKAAG